MVERPADTGQVPVRGRARRIVGGLSGPLLTALVWAGATAVLLVRPSGRPTWRVIWAEDGRDFLTGAYLHPGPGGWLRSYAGYLHLLPRMIGSLAAALPPQRAAEVFALTAAAVAAGCLLLLGHGLRRWLPAPWLPALVAVTLVLVNGLGREVAANAANLHWFTTLGTLGLILLRPRTARGTAVAAAGALVLALSDALAFLLVPIAVVDAVARTRGRHDRREGWLAWPVAATVTLGAVAQVLTQLLAPRTPPPPGRLGYSAGQLVHLYEQQVLLAGIAPRWGSLLAPGVALGLAAALWLALLAFGWATAGRAALGRVLLAVALGALSALVFVLTLQVNRGFTERYAALPAVLVVLALLVPALGPRTANRVAVLAMCTLLVVAELASFRTHPARGTGPDWASSVRRAAVQCTVAGAGVEVVTIAPLRRPGDPRPPWTAEVPCNRLPAALTGGSAAP